VMQEHPALRRQNEAGSLREKQNTQSLRIAGQVSKPCQVILLHLLVLFICFYAVRIWLN